MLARFAPVSEIASPAAPRYAVTGWASSLPLILTAAFAARLLAMALPGYIYHPDETFQVLEAGHRLAFGYGFIPWEYEVGLRNWLLPGAIAAILRGLALGGLDRPSIYVPFIQIFFCLLSLTAVASAWTIGRVSAGLKGARAAAWVVALLPIDLLVAQKATPEVLSSYALLGALAFALAEETRARALATGALCGLAVGLRLQHAPVALVPFFLVATRPTPSLARAALCIAGGVLALLPFGLADWIAWGIPFVSYWRNVTINLSGVANQFGTSPWHMFLPLLVPIALLRADLQRFWPAALMACIVVFTHSVIAHKEWRFVVAFWPLAGAFCGVGLSRADGPGLRRVTALALLALLGSCQFAAIGAKYDFHREPLDEAREAFRLMGDDPTVRGIVVSDLRALQPGYFGLHRQVPVRLVAPDGIAAVAGVTHALVPVETPPDPAFEPVWRGRYLELRRRRAIDASAPPIAFRFVLPLVYDETDHRLHERTDRLED